MTKDAIRHKVWTRVTAAGVVRFPGAYGRVPNFIGAERAAKLLSQLTIWKRAKALKVDLGAPQLALRRAALADGKILYIAVPGLRSERCFLEVDPARLNANAWRAASLRGALAYGRPVAPHEIHAIDLVLVGSVAVSRQGARVGRGSGSADLEYALLRRAGKVREYTPIVTTVHPLQARGRSHRDARPRHSRRLPDHAGPGGRGAEPLSAPARDPLGSAAGRAHPGDPGVAQGPSRGARHTHPRADLIHRGLQSGPCCLPADGSIPSGISRIPIVRDF